MADDPAAHDPPHDDERAFDDLPVAPSQTGHGSPNDRTWAVMAHLSIVPLAIAFPLVVVLWKGERNAYIGHQAVEALNFQTTVLLAVLLCTLLAAVVGALLLPVVLVGAFGLSVRAARCARRGAWHRYPLTVRFVS